MPTRTALLLALVLVPLSLALSAAPDSPPADEKPVAIKQAAPEYPRDLRKKRVQGTVLVEFVIGSDGTVKSARAVESPDPRLSKLAEAAVLKWKFIPGKKAGVAVNTLARQTLTFGFQEKEKDAAE